MQRRFSFHSGAFARVPGRHIPKPISCWVSLVLLGLALGGSGSAFAHGDLQERIAAVTRSIQSDPTNPELFLRRGELRRLHGETAEAIADLERALALDPDQWLAQLGLGRAFLDAHDPAAAKDRFDAFLGKYPRHSEALLFRARALVALGRCSAAAADYTGALTAVGAPLPDIYLERASVLAKDGQVDEAIAGLDEGLRRVGQVASLQLRAVDLETSRQRYDAALTRLDRLIERAPRKEFLLYRRAGILEQAGRHAAARADYLAVGRAVATLPPERRGTPAVMKLLSDSREAADRLAAFTAAAASAVPRRGTSP